MAVLHHESQQVKHLWLDGDRLGSATQFEAIRVQNIIVETKLHVCDPKGGQ